VHRALNVGGVFCFNAVDKYTIDNAKFENHDSQHDNSQFTFISSWHYPGTGDQQSLMLSIDKTDLNGQQTWEDRHLMVAVSFDQLQQMLAPYFEITIFEHNYETLRPWAKHTGNAIFSCVKL
jgi:hypothetical protein